MPRPMHSGPSPLDIGWASLLGLYNTRTWQLGEQRRRGWEGRGGEWRGGEGGQRCGVVGGTGTYRL